MTDLSFPHGSSVLAGAVRSFDWGRTPLGPIKTWGVPLRTAVDMMLNSKFPKCIVWGPGLTTLYNDAFGPILSGKPEALGRSFLDVWHEVREEISPILDKAFGGQATFIEDFPLVIERNGFSEQAYFTFCYSPIFDEQGRVAGIIDTVMETTQTVEAIRNIQTLNAELGHRNKNVLAMVAGIANQTFRTTHTKEDAQRQLAGRIAALGNAQDVLTQSSWRGAPLRTVVEGVLVPIDPNGERISLKGPNLNLAARQSLSLSLAVHELTTNAIKYGALASPSGRVSIAWKIGAPRSPDAFSFVWQEEGGPQIAAPTKKGFGSRLIEQVLAADFGGHVELDYDPSGLRCELVSTLAQMHLAEDAVAPSEP
ncbi:MAG: histidine kinase [Ancylobacter novellus]|uniref:histidine kinase n=1 Tax=Ancylobacter novellus TaxID=921 RepID=A0A2W5R9I1_ANCNO|nr:MAG: histidine kinase [Ancylobacter novellus]